LPPGGTATQEFPASAAERQRLRLPNFSLSTLSELYIENLKRGEFFLYIFVGITCGMGGASDGRFLRSSGSPVSKHVAQFGEAMNESHMGHLSRFRLILSRIASFND
jgi:hypothetical protein